MRNIFGGLRQNNYVSVLSGHIIAWGLFICYEILFVYTMTGMISTFYDYAINYLIIICLFYLNTWILLRHSSYKFKGAIAFTCLIILIELALFTLIKYILHFHILGTGITAVEASGYSKYFTSNTWRSVYFIGLSVLYWAFLQIIKRNREIAGLEKQKLVEQNEKILLQQNLLRSRNAYLQSQVNPHLLFNSLNFMYNASAKVSEKLADAVMTLSDLMRYALTSIGKDDKVPLEEEIGHIRNYIHLNQIRYEDRLNIRMELKGETQDCRIIPLALITPVENIFKYGDLQDTESPALIKLSILNGYLEAELFNKKRANQRSHGHGTGITNLRERLNIYYPGVYTLDIQDTKNTYLLKLKINLNP